MIEKVELTTHIEKRDSVECMDGIKCVYPSGSIY